MDELGRRMARVDGIDAVRERSGALASQEDIAAVERGRAQIAAGQSHDMEDVIAELEAIVGGD